MIINEDKLYTQDHEWIKVEENTGTIGITDYAQKQLGDIVFIELPPLNKEVKAGEILATIESVKAVAEVYAPVSGVIYEVNTNLSSDPSLINQSPYKDGWIAKIKINQSDELKKLMTPKQYQEYVNTLIKS